MVYTLDNKPIGYLLSSGNVYLNLSTGSEDEVQNQKISQVQKLLQEKLSEIESLKNKNEDLEVRLHRLESLLSK